MVRCVLEFCLTNLNLYWESSSVQISFWMSEYLTFITFIESLPMDEESIIGGLLTKKLSLSYTGLSYYLGMYDLGCEDLWSEDLWSEDLRGEDSGELLSESLAWGCKY